MVESLSNEWSSDSSMPFHLSQSRDERIKEAAVHHARLLQDRKDIEMRILESIELLIDYPTSLGLDAAHPSIKDTAEIKQMLIPFQPSDFDALVEERNINKKCGYVLCPKSNKQQHSKAKFGFVYSKGTGTKIVDQKTLERWCSSGCGKRALYLRVQLAEEPAWERVGRGGGEFELMEEDSSSQVQTDATVQVTESLGKLDVHSDEDNMVAALKELAIERGNGNARTSSKTMANIRIMENGESGKAHPSLPNPSNHDEIEGYQPRVLQGRPRPSVFKY